MAYRGRLRVLRPPTPEERAAWFAANATSVPEQLRRQERLGAVGLAVFVFLGGLSLAERFVRRFV